MPSGKYKHKSMSEEQKRQISAANRGRVRSDEFKKKVSEKLKNRIIPEEVKEKIRKTMTGRKYSEERKKNISIAHLGHKGYWLGKKRKMTEDHIDKIIKAISERKRGEETDIETKLYSKLKELKFQFETQKLINNKFIVDAFIPSLNLIIEADGNYWHSLDRIKKKDKAENAYLTKCGYNIIRLTETQINNNDWKEIKNI